MNAVDEQVVMLVDDDPSHRRLTRRWLEHAGYSVVAHADGTSALADLADTLPSVILLDLYLETQSGLDLLPRFKQLAPHIPVVMLTAESAVATVVEAMQSGAWDYLTKPVNRPRLLATVRNAVEHYRMAHRLRHLEREVAGGGYGGLLGQSPVMAALFRQLDRVAPSDVTVLVMGESGTGKELVAQAIHRNSGRADKAFVAINCAAIPENLQESELFGHKKGAFTGATEDRKGRFEQANGGTLFLDEVAELSPGLQAKLLRALQERRFYPVGGSEEIQVDVRIVAATHRELADAVAAGDFRSDLFYRLAVFELHLPPLRDREEDLLLLAQHFLDISSQRYGREPLHLGHAVCAHLMGYGWPGNVRELQNAMARAAVSAEGSQVGPEHLPPRISGQGVGSSRAAAAVSRPAPPTPVPPMSAAVAPPEDDGLQLRGIERVERQAILDAIDAANGNMSEVIRQLGIPRTSFYRKLKRYGLTP